VPTLPAASQAWHWPPQAVLQHTPSTHWPLWHWLAPEQVEPLPSLGVQAPEEQKSPAMQSPSAAQVVRQAVGPQT
jgi:hypothetical protein